MKDWSLGYWILLVVLCIDIGFLLIGDRRCPLGSWEPAGIITPKTILNPVYIEVCSTTHLIRVSP